MKRGLMIALLVLAIIAVACAPENPITFEDGYKELIALDSKYGGDFKNEILKKGGKMVPMESINPFVADVNALKEKYSAMPVTNDTLNLINLTDARLEMLEAERYYQLFENVGPAGLVSDTFRCSEIPAITKATSYMSASMNHFYAFTVLVDRMLADYKDIRPILGVDSERMNFYRSDLEYLSDQIKSNKISVKTYCGVAI
ncbi:MAG TPA: hypothetical protein VJC07_00435 [Candidatus Nanoarchaeia archaeon]|nr:hypothetical protein [Candidatus Nanoarchaeia archaeon]